MVGISSGIQTRRLDLMARLEKTLRAITNRIPTAQAKAAEQIFGERSAGDNIWRLFIEEGRHHRDHENDLIWGTEQRLWLQNRINESDATYKIIITTTPVLAPLGDPPIYEYADKHANGRFREETITFLNEIKDMPDVFFICGDRHWKHFSVINQSNYPEFSDFHEFSVGSAAGGEHAIVPRSNRK